jgi:hypothetical protein
LKFLRLLHALKFPPLDFELELEGGEFVISTFAFQSAGKGGSCSRAVVVAWWVVVAVVARGFSFPAVTAAVSPWAIATAAALAVTPSTGTVFLASLPLAGEARVAGIAALVAPFIRFSCRGASGAVFAITSAVVIAVPIS